MGPSGMAFSVGIIIWLANAPSRKCRISRRPPSPRALQPCSTMSGVRASSRERTVMSQATQLPGFSRVLSGPVVRTRPIAAVPGTMGSSMS